MTFRLSRRSGRLATALILGSVLLLGGSPAQAQERVPTWQWSADEVRETVHRVRAGRSLQPESWPGGARVAVLLSFDVDNELLALDSRNIGAISQGEYGSRVALRRVLDMLDRYEIPASFFIPAVSLQLAPEMADQIAASGRHEFALHGWIHENNASLPAEEERRLVRQAMDYFEEVTGSRPVGYRAPSWNFSENTMDIIREFGFLYDSSLMADDRPYELLAEGEPTGIVELPVDWILDDYPLLNVQGNRYSSPAEVLQVWKEEFDRAYEEGTMFILTTHPHVIGRRSRMTMLEDLVEYIHSKGDDVWFATHRAAAEHAKAHGGGGSIR